MAGDGLLAQLIRRPSVDLTINERFTLQWLISNYGYISGIKDSFDKKSQLIRIGEGGNISQGSIKISKAAIRKQFQKFLSLGLIEPINVEKDLTPKQRVWTRRYGIDLHKVTVFGLYQYAKATSSVPREGAAKRYWEDGNAFYKTVLNPFFEWRTFEHCPIEVDYMFQDFIRRSCRIIEEVIEWGRTIDERMPRKGLDSNLDNPDTIAYLEERLETELLENAKEFASMYMRDYAVGRCGEYLYSGTPRPDQDMIMNYLAHDRNFMRILDMTKKEFDAGYKAAKRFEKTKLKIKYTMMPPFPPLTLHFRSMQRGGG